MINFPAILIANVTGIALMITIIMSSRKTMGLGLLDEKIFYSMIAMTCFQCFFETVTLYIDGRVYPYCIPISYITNTLLYIVNITFAFNWIVYADYKVFQDIKRIRHIYPYLSIPAVLVIVLALVNNIYPIFFTISSNNVYSRTNLYLFPFILTYVYLMYGVILIYKNRRRAAKYLFLPAIIFMIPIFIASVFQYFFYGYSFIWLGTSLGLVSLYINIQNQVTNIDALSGVYTRQYMYNYLEVQLRRRIADRRLIGIMLDVDSFKCINDTFGHLAGDQAISYVGEILRNSVEQDGFVIRYAGDEFIVIQYVKSVEEVNQLINKIDENAKFFNENYDHPYNLEFSYGYSILDYKKDTIDSFLKDMDQNMYENKKIKEKHSILK